MSMRQLVLSVLLCNLATIGFTQADSADKISNSKRDYSQEAFVIEQSLGKIKFENDGTSTREDSGRIRIQSDAGLKHFGVLTFSYEDATGKFEVDYVRVQKPDGTVVLTPPESIQDMAAQITREAPFYSDLREKQVAVKGLGIGDVLEFKTHRYITKPLAPGQFWFQYSFTHDGILLQEQVEVSVPRDREIKLKSSNVKPTISDAGQYRVYTWVASHLEHTSDEKEKRDKDDALWQQARGRFPQTDIQLSSFLTWEDVARWYGNLQQERVRPSPEIQAKMAELTKGAADDKAKTQALYKYVSTKFRYIGIAFGIGRYQPHAASEVLDNQYGDCKDKHTLLASLLNAAGIKAYPALISSVRDIDEDVPSPGQFNHVITAIPQDSGFLWLDTTAEVGPFAYLVPNLRDKRALVIPYDKPAMLVNTPSDLPFRSMQNFRIKSKLSEAGALEGNAEFSSLGDLDVVLRSAFRSVPLPNWNQLVQKISYSFGFAGDVTDATAGSPENTDEPFHFAYKYTRKDFGDWPTHRIVAPMPQMALPTLNDDDHPPSFPVWLGPPSDITFRGEMELPAGYTPELPSAIHEKRSFAEYDVVYSFKNRIFTAERHLRIIQRELAPERYAEYKTFRKIVQDDYAAFISLRSATVLSESSVPAPGVSEIAAMTSFQSSLHNLPGSLLPEAARLEEKAKDSATHKNMQGAITSLYRALAIDPSLVRGWITLGGLLMFSHQIDAGIDAFHKGIAADPKQPLTYKAFGYSLMASQKFEEAVPIWQELIKIAPEDTDGPANLTRVYFQLKRYPEAVSALESAVKQNPERVELQQSLVFAYLRAGHDDKAATLSAKVLALSPDSGMLNGVAYEFAQANKQLPLALEYAKKAVQEVESDSTKTKLPELKLEDVQRMSQLASYWDTLGWVYFRMAHLDQAEKYLNAAWLLSQDGIIAGHLCQVYDTLHQTQAAINMCQLALYRIALSTTGFDEAATDMKDLRSLLDRLHPGASATQEMNIASSETSKMRSFKLPRVVTGTASAEFFVLLAPDSKTSEFKVLDTKFISGSERLKNSGKALASINFKWPAPENFSMRLVRRGVLGCFPYSGCAFVLLDQSSIRSVD